jgi:hypothetical protein
MRRFVLAGLLALVAAPAGAQTRPAQRPAPPPPAPAPPPPAVAIPPQPADPQAQMARDALAEVARFLLGRGGHLGPGDGSGGATQEQLDNALADIEIARQIAEVYGLADMQLALAAYDAVAQFAPLTRHRTFEFEPLVTNSGRVFPAFNAATDAIDQAYPDARARREVLADPARAADPALPLPVLVAAAVAKAASQAPFVALEIMDRCGRPGERAMSRTMLTAVGLAAPDIYDFFLRNFVDPAGPQSRAAFIRNVRGAAARCAQ